MELKTIIEALLFACPEPISAKELAQCIQRKLEDEDAPDSDPPENGSSSSVGFVAKPKDVETAISTLNLEYEQTGRAFRIVEGPCGWRMASQPEFADWIRELFPGHKPAKLSPPALETLAIIAYRQPITKSDIEAVRGVSVDGVMNKIIDRGLITIVGKADLPGRPLLYGTTELFMEHFGIKTVDDLPNAAELRSVKLPGAENEDGSKSDQQEQQLELAEVQPTQPTEVSE
tara:strand:- start:21300 stop:21992 length:693 start_codon:yes stop_codon:yes gene_type:complete